jgi:hypothetical protein
MSGLARAVLAAGAVGVCCQAAGAQAAETVSLHTSFSPDRLGAATTISFNFQIASTANGGRLPSALQRVDLRMPTGMNYITSTLGTSSCRAEVLVNDGVAGCPSNSRLGHGRAYAEVPFGSSIAGEGAEVQAVMGPPRNGNVVVLFFVEGHQPVWAPLVFPGELLPPAPPFGETLATVIPEIKGVPGGPPVSIRYVGSTIGPNHLTYYKHVHKKLVAYKPKGVALPERCPRGGFRFIADFTFEDHSVVTANSTVPCPSRRK